MGKANSEVQKNFNAYITLVVPFKIRVKYVFFSRWKKKTIQWIYDKNLRTFVVALFKRDAFRPYWEWNNLVSRAINNNWDKVLKNRPSKICGRQPLKLKVPQILQGPFLNILPIYCNFFCISISWCHSWYVIFEVKRFRVCNTIITTCMWLSLVYWNKLALKYLQLHSNELYSATAISKNSVLCMFS